MTIRRLGALAAILLLVGGCSAAGGTSDNTADGSGGELQATTWVLNSYAAASGLAVVPDGQYADADFWAQRVKGFAGCNDYDAVYRNSGRQLLVGMPATTLMSCGEVADAFQTAYLSLLQHSRFYNVRGDTLTIRGWDAAILLVFDAAPANPLLGSWVVDSLATTTGSVAVPLSGTTLTAAFRLRNVSGSSGCNTFQGQYTTNGSVVAIGPLATTQMACAEDVMAQEQAFLKDLQGVGRVERRGDRLILSDVGGRTLVGMVKPSTAEPSPGPSASATVSAAPTATPTASPTAAPTATPTAAPTATPTAAPTATPTAAPTATPTGAPSGSPAPSVAPPASLPPLANCALGATTIVYPAAWHTLPPPSTGACRYFSAAPITTPPDPATLVTGVMIVPDAAATYADALTAATNPTAWNVLKNEAVTVSGLPATRIEATSTAGVPGFPVGLTRYGYLIDIAGLGAWIETGGTVTDASFGTSMSVVDLMASQSTIVPPVPF